MRPETGLWQDVSGLPESLAAREGVEDVAALLGAQGVRRIVATGVGSHLRNMVTAIERRPDSIPDREAMSMYSPTSTAPSRLR